MVDGQRKVDRELKNTTGSLDAFGAKVTQITAAVTAYAAALFLVRQSDAFTKLNAQLKLATDSSRQLAVAQASVRQIAQEAQTDISGVGVLYARVSNATRELGKTQADVAAITRTVALALKVSGATAQESASATLQLSQAFGSGALRGEEFNAVNEAAPRLMKALAEGIGVPIGQLRGLAEQGKLTSEVLANALPKALKDLEQEAKVIQTIGGAFQQLRNEVMLFIGEQTTASGSAKLTADAISSLANNINLLAAAAYGYAAAKLAKVLLDVSIQAAQSAKVTIDGLVAQRAATAAAIAETAAKIELMAATQAGIVVARQEMVAKLASANAAMAAASAQAQAARSAGAQSFALALVREAEVAATAASHARSAALLQLAILGQQQARTTATMAAAQTAHTAALTATGTAATIASRALGLLGGPIGLITTALGLGVTAWAMWGNAAKDNEAKATESVERSTDDIVAGLDKQIAKLKERNALASAGLGAIAKQDSEAANRLATLQGQINNLMSGKGLDGGDPLPEAAQIDLLQKLLAQYGTLAGKVRAVADEHEKLAAIGTASKLTQWMAKYATDAEKARVEIEKAKAELGSAFTPELEQRIRQKFMPDKKEPKDRFDEAGYLAGLSKQVASPFDRINLEEQEAIRKNSELLKEGKISRLEAARASTLIEENAVQDRRDIWLRDGEERRAFIQKQGEEEADARAKLEEDQKRGREFAVSTRVAEDPIAKLQFDLQAKSALLAQYAAIDQENIELYAQAKLALEQDTANKIAEIRTKQMADQQAQQAAANQLTLAMASSAAGDILSLLQKAGKERTTLGKALFLAQKAIAVAEIIMNTEIAAAKAGAQLGIFGIPMAAMIRATGYASAGMVAGMAIGEVAGSRQYGGPASAGSLYRVNEGGRPEMFTASNGRQFMLPNASGRVTPAGDVDRSRNDSTVIQQTNNFYGSGAGTDRRSSLQLTQDAVVALQRAQRNL